LSFPLSAHQSVGRSALWRLHALAALLAAPFLIVAVITGLIYVPTPQIERWQHALLDEVRPAPWRPLDELVDRALEVAPAGFVLRHVQPPHAPGQSLRLQLVPVHATPMQGEHAGHGATSGPVNVFLDPGTGALLGTEREGARFNTWAKKLHSQLLMGEGMRWMVEWAATCLLVMLTTGLLLLAPQAWRWQRGLRGRLAWRQWHVLGGLLLAGLTLTMVLTGLTWSQSAGAQIRALRDASGQAPPRAPKALRSLPPPVAAQPLSWGAVQALAQAQSPGVRLQISPPLGADGVWRISSTDRHRPAQRVELALDAYSGAVLWRAGWTEQTLFSKATALGIPFHRGEFGLWNQALLLLFGLGVLGSVLSGMRMAWLRWRASGLLLPRLAGWRPLRVQLALALPLLALLCLLLPLMAAFLLIVLAVEVSAAHRARAVHSA
jgi:uncharacterized iron-regulated membrane protein